MSHVPVLVAEVLAHAAPGPKDRLLDATLGHGGHAAAWLDGAPGTTVVGFEADPEAVAVAQQQLAPYGERVTYVNRNFASLKDSIIGGGILPEFTHVLFDLGIGSHQLADTQRGFSFQSGATLTMRYGDQTNLPDAQLASLNHLSRRLNELPDVPELLAYLSADELADVIWTYGEERYSRRIARALKEAPLPATAQEAADRVARAVPAVYRHGRLHPATRTFQALRLAVNHELEALSAALPQALELLAPSGTLLVISFHSLEDRIVKRFMKDRAASGQLAILTKKPVTPTEIEINRNPRARSAKLRVSRRPDTG